jgi:hypothetical protein
LPSQGTASMQRGVTVPMMANVAAGPVSPFGYG